VEIDGEELRIEISQRSVIERINCFVIHNAQEHIFESFEHCVNIYLRCLFSSEKLKLRDILGFQGSVKTVCFFSKYAR
jgi:hypothetical protein